MTPTSRHVSSLEICIEAFKIWGAFFFLTTIVQLIASDTRVEQVAIISVGGLAIGVIFRQWLTRIRVAQLIGNLALLMAAMLIALDMVVALATLIN